MNEIRYWVHDWDTYSGGPPDGATPEQTPHYFEVVRASDFDALRAEVERLRMAEAEAMAVVYSLEGTVERLRGNLQGNLEEMAEAWGEVERLRAALADSLGGLRYIEQRYGKLDGVGWDRVYSYAESTSPSPGTTQEGT
jgi:hypothetical protein